MGRIEVALEGASDRFREFASGFPVCEIEHAHSVVEATIAAGEKEDSQIAREIGMIGQLLIRPAFEDAFGVKIEPSGRY